jgi:uncharacterized protein YkwD
MKQVELFLIIALVFSLNSCVGTEKSTPNSLVTLSANAGDDQRVLVNETITIRGEGEATDKTELSYLWEKGSETLATTATFSYTPTRLGTENLTLIVTHNSGAIISDTMKIMVVDSEVISSTPTFSQNKIDEYLFAINKARSTQQNCGTGGAFSATTALLWNEKLYKSSYEHTQDLISSQTFSHFGSGSASDWTGTVLGKSSVLDERIETYNYKWKTIGENIGAGTLIDTAEKMVDKWLKSDNHCANLMNPNFTEVGMVLIKDENSLYTHYWTQNFGTPK